jgi:phosphoglycerate dehydrogenase-like enzyme
MIVEHENLKRGQFNQFARNRMLAGGVCGIFGFGGIGAATGRLMSSIGMRVYGAPFAPWFFASPNNSDSLLLTRSK